MKKIKLTNRIAELLDATNPVSKDYFNTDTPKNKEELELIKLGVYEEDGTISINCSEAIYDYIENII